MKSVSSIDVNGVPFSNVHEYVTLDSCSIVVWPFALRVCMCNPKLKKSPEEFVWVKSNKMKMYLCVGLRGWSACMLMQHAIWRDRYSILERSILIDFTTARFVSHFTFNYLSTMTIISIHFYGIYFHRIARRANKWILWKIVQLSRRLLDNMVSNWFEFMRSCHGPWIIANPKHLFSINFLLLLRCLCPEWALAND